jgi:hypothetical protein
MSDSETVWYYPDGNLQAMGREIPRSELPTGATAVGEHVTDHGTLTAYVGG